MNAPNWFNFDKMWVIIQFHDMLMSKSICSTNTHIHTHAVRSTNHAIALLRCMARESSINCMYTNVFGAIVRKFDLCEVWAMEKKNGGKNLWLSPMWKCWYENINDLVGLLNLWIVWLLDCSWPSIHSATMYNTQHFDSFRVKLESTAVCFRTGKKQ